MRPRRLCSLATKIYTFKNIYTCTPSPRHTGPKIRFLMCALVFMPLNAVDHGLSQTSEVLKCDQMVTNSVQQWLVVVALSFLVFSTVMTTELQIKTLKRHERYWFLRCCDWFWVGLERFGDKSEAPLEGCQAGLTRGHQMDHL